jgi:hypothetical protein
MSRLAMPKNKALTALFAALALVPAGLVAAAPAGASSSQVLADCNSNGHLTGTYSRGDLQAALNGMGADTREYTNCYDVVRRALLSSAAAGAGKTGGGNSAGGGGGGNSAGGGGGGSSAGGGGGGNASGSGHSGSAHGNPGVSTRGVYSNASGGTAGGSGSNGAVSLDGSMVHPGSAGVNTSSGVRSLPVPLIGVLVVLGLAALGGGGIALRRRVVARHGG